MRRTRNRPTFDGWGVYFLPKSGLGCAGVGCEAEIASEAGGDAVKRVKQGLTMVEGLW